MCMCCLLWFFFFKQKTAYEMRISDWSSDVCSSDLTADKAMGRGYARNARIASFVGAFPMDDPRYVIFAMVDEPKPTKETYGYATGGWVARSEEHTSELQSLMRISYAVFCLKKKKILHTIHQLYTTRMKTRLTQTLV